MTTVNIPALPPPTEIKGEIRRLKARIGVLKTILPAAEVQQVSNSLDQKRQQDTNNQVGDDGC